jgi:hypothetical protein
MVNVWHTLAGLDQDRYYEQNVDYFVDLRPNRDIRHGFAANIPRMEP